MTTTETVTNIDAGGFEWGRSAKLMAYRNYMGLNQNEFAERIGINRRSLQRMETGTTAVPPGLWDKCEALLAEFRKLVDVLVAEAATHGHGGLCELTVDDDATGWARTIAAHAMMASPATVLLVNADDKDAIEEMMGSDEHHRKGP
jgi:DNA-binding XRE family transcriptional regulator